MTIQTPNEFKEVLSEHINVGNMKDAWDWIKQQRVSIPDRDDFIAMCKLALIDDISPYRYDSGKKYIDKFRKVDTK